MPEKRHHPTPEERDEPLAVPLDAEEFIEGLLAVDPDGEPAADEDAGEVGS